MVTALGTVARARGMSQVASALGYTFEMRTAP